MTTQIHTCSMQTTKAGAVVSEIGGRVATTGPTHRFINMKGMIIKICSLDMNKKPESTKYTANECNLTLL